MRERHCDFGEAGSVVLPTGPLLVDELLIAPSCSPVPGQNQRLRDQLMTIPRDTTTMVRGSLLSLFHRVRRGRSHKKPFARTRMSKQTKGEQPVHPS